MKFFFKMMARVSTAYVIAQVITGIEVGVIAAAIVVLAGWTLPAAMAVAFPIGLPLVSLQMAAVIAIQSRRSPLPSNTTPSLT